MVEATAAGLLWFGVFTLPLFWFWLIVAAWIILAIADIHYERPGWATFWLVAFLSVLHLGGVVDIVRLVVEHPVWLLAGVGGYVVAGLIWTVIKFKFRIRKIRVNINTETMPALRRKFLDSKQVRGDTVPANLRDEWLEFQNNAYGLQEEIQSMDVGRNKGRLLLWAIWWPFSMLWTAFSDWILDFFNWLIFDVLGNMLKAMVDREKGKINRD